MWHAHDGMGWWMAFSGLWVVLFWVGLFLFLFWDVRSLMTTGRRESTPLDIARRRYAKGEISREEFDRIKEACS